MYIIWFVLGQKCLTDIFLHITFANIRVIKTEKICSYNSLFQRIETIKLPLYSDKTSCILKLVYEDLNGLLI